MIVLIFLLLFGIAFLIGMHSNEESLAAKLSKEVDSIERKVREAPSNLSTSQIYLINLKLSFRLPVELLPSNSSYDILMKNASDLTWEECLSIDEEEYMGACIRKLCEAGRFLPVDLWKKKLQHVKSYTSLYHISGKLTCLSDPRASSFESWCEKLWELYRQKGIPELSDFPEYSAFAIAFYECTGNEKYFNSLVKYHPKTYKEMLWFMRSYTAFSYYIQK